MKTGALYAISYVVRFSRFHSDGSLDLHLPQDLANRMGIEPTKYSLKGCSLTSLHAGSLFGGCRRIRTYYLSIIGRGLIHMSFATIL